MPNIRHPFEPDTIYHVYNHGNADDLIFREMENYRFFLKRFKSYISHIATVYAYCLMPNHFHFLLRIKAEKEILDFYEEKHPDEVRSAMSQQDIADLKTNLPNFCSNQFKNFLISYSKSFNNMYDRRGSLFLDNIQRTPVTNEDYFTTMVRYIHFNPVLHRFVNRPVDWKFSSFHAFLTEKRTLIDKRFVLDWFGGSEQFIKFHQSIQEDEFDTIRHLTIE